MNQKCPHLNKMEVDSLLDFHKGFFPFTRVWTWVGNNKRKKNRISSRKTNQIFLWIVEWYKEHHL